MIEVSRYREYIMVKHDVLPIYGTIGSAKIWYSREWSVREYLGHLKQLYYKMIDDYRCMWG